MKPAVLSPAARRDLLAAVRWIAKDNKPAALAFRNSVAKAAENIGEHINLGSLRPELAEAPYRFVTLTGFPYIIVYNAALRPLTITRIIHGARDLTELLRGM